MGKWYQNPHPAFKALRSLVLSALWLHPPPLRSLLSGLCSDSVLWNFTPTPTNTYIADLYLTTPPYSISIYLAVLGLSCGIWDLSCGAWIL